MHDIPGHSGPYIAVQTWFTPQLYVDHRLKLYAKHLPLSNWKRKRLNFSLLFVWLNCDEHQPRRRVIAFLRFWPESTNVMTYTYLFTYLVVDASNGWLSHWRTYSYVRCTDCWAFCLMSRRTEHQVSVTHSLTMEHVTRRAGVTCVFAR